MCHNQSTHRAIGDTSSALLRALRDANKRPATFTAYQTDLSQFARFLAETNCTISAPADVSRGDVAEYLAYLAEQGMSGTTRARKLAAIPEFLCCIEDEGEVTTSSTLSVAIRKKVRGSHKSLARPANQTWQPRERLGGRKFASIPTDQRLRRRSRTSVSSRQQDTANPLNRDRGPARDRCLAAAGRMPSC